MVTENINKSENDKLFVTLDNQLRGLKKRNINFQINVHDVNIAIINVLITGRRGTVTRNLILMNDNLDGWIVYNNTKKHLIDNLSELSTIVRALIQRLSTVVNKF